MQRLYFHHLSRYPGPKLWAISRLPYVIVLLRGTLVQRTKELHDRYGDAVRIAPNEVSFSNAQAWQDIYAHHQGRANFPKNPLWMVPGVDGIHSILSANDADHARYRRLLAHAFSEKALIQQEDLLQSYVELLINRLSEKCTASKTAIVDVVEWLNFTTFDIIGDLSFGESFGCLQESKYHGWVSILFQQFRAAAFFISFRFYKLDKIIRKMIPKGLAQKQIDHMNYANEKVDRRLTQGDAGQRNDFMTYVQRYNDEKGMSVPEIKANFRTLVLVGSETTATALSGIISNLILYPDVMEKLTREIRDAFSSPAKIRAEPVSKLTYLSAVIEEGLRLCPPVPLGMPRIVPPGGGEVSGQWLPAGVIRLGLYHVVADILYRHPYPLLAGLLIALLRIFPILPLRLILRAGWTRNG